MAGSQKLRVTMVKGNHLVQHHLLTSGETQMILTACGRAATRVQVPQQLKYPQLLL